MQYFRVKYRQFRKKSEIESHIQIENSKLIGEDIDEDDDDNKEDNDNKKDEENIDNSDDEISKKFDKEFMVREINRERIWGFFFNQKSIA